MSGESDRIEREAAARVRLDDLERDVNAIRGVLEEIPGTLGALANELESSERPKVIVLDLPDGFDADDAGDHLRGFQ